MCCITLWGLRIVSIYLGFSACLKLSWVPPLWNTDAYLLLIHVMIDETKMVSFFVLWWRWPHEGAGKGRKYEEPDLNNSEWWIPVHFWPALNIWGDDKLTTDDGFKNTVKLRILRCFLCALPLLWGTKNKGDFLLSVNGKKSVEHFFSVGSLHLETTLPLPLRAVLLTLRSCRKSDRSHVVRGKVRKRELYF